MDCERIREWISLRADGPLAAEEARAVEAHLRDCEGCRAFERDLERMKAFYASWEAPDVPEGLRDRILAAGRLELARRRRWSAFQVAGRLAAAALLVLAITIGFFYLDGAKPMQATDTNKEVHYADLLHRDGGAEGALLRALLATNNPREALNVYARKEKP